MELRRYLNQFRRLIGLRLRVGIYTPSMTRLMNSQKIKIFELEDLGKHVPIITKEPYFHPSWSSDLKKCKKNGGYKKIMGRFYWSHNSFNFFDFNKKIYGGIPPIISGASICKIRNVDYFPEFIEGNNVSKYTFRTKKNRNKSLDFENAFAFNFSGSNLFQHFVQDCLPILAASKHFLKQNPNLPILMPRFSNESQIRNKILDLIGITNQVVETNFQKISVGDLYFWDFKPFPAKYAIPDLFYEILQSELSYLYKDNKVQKLILITRKEHHRNFANQTEVIRQAKILAENLRLKLVIIDSSSATFEDWKNNLPDAKVVIGMHGGALFNLIMCRPGTILFELIPTNSTDSVINTFTKLGLKVVPVPINFSKNELNAVHIPGQIFHEILKISSQTETTNL